MKKISFLFTFFVLLGIFFFVLPKSASAVTCTSAGNGDWNNTGTWSGCSGGNGTPANTPGPADTAVITSTHNVTVTTGVTVSALQFGTGSTNGILKINSGVTLTVTNAVTLRTNSSANTAGTIQDSTSGGIITAASLA